jgi:hypothetical protein
MTAIPLPIADSEPAGGLAVREADFSDWLRHAGPGDGIEYHRGVLAWDRQPGRSPLPADLRDELIGIANLALALVEEGRLLLVQRRHGAGDYSYLAIMSRRRPRSMSRHVSKSGS